MAQGAPVLPVSPPSAHLTEALLIARARAGDGEAFASLVRTWQDRVFTTVLRMVNRRDDAEDLCQEAFVRAWHALPHFEERASFGTWIFRIAVNLCLSHRRDQRRHPVEPLPSGSPDDNGHAGSGEIADPRAARPEEATLADERRRAVQSAIAALDPESRAVVVLRDLQDQSYEEIADELGVPVGTVRSRLHRARMELKDRLKGMMTEKAEPAGAERRLNI